MAFIIDTYDKYDAFDRAHSKYKFQNNDIWYAIKEVELEWGKPVLPFHIDRDNDLNSYFIFNSFHDAMRFVQQIKSLNA